MYYNQVAREFQSYLPGHPIQLLCLSGHRPQRPLQNLNHIKPAKRNSFIVVISFACGLMILTISSDNLIVLIRCYPRFLCLHRATLGEFILLIFFIRDQKYRYVLGRWFFVKFRGKRAKRFISFRVDISLISNFIVLFFAVYKCTNFQKITDDSLCADASENGRKV